MDLRAYQLLHESTKIEYQKMYVTKIDAVKSLTTCIRLEDNHANKRE